MVRETFRDTDFSGHLAANGLKKQDVKVFAGIFGLTDSEAAERLIDLGVKGDEISEGRRNHPSGRVLRLPRAEAAKRLFKKIWYDDLGLSSKGSSD